MSRYTFPILDIPEIVLTLHKCDFAMANEVNIRRPTSEYIITLYKQIIESYMGLSADHLLTLGVNANKESVTNDNNDEHNVLNVLVLNKICFKFFLNIGVTDFNIMDLYKPDHLRVQRLLSAVVNFARFRVEKMEDCTDIIEKSGVLLDELTSTFHKFNYLQNIKNQYVIKSHPSNELDNVSPFVDSINNEEELKRLDSENAALEIELKKLTAVQEQLKNNYDNYKRTKNDLFTGLESVNFKYIELESEKKKLEKFTNANIVDINRKIDDVKSQIKIYDEKLISLQEKQNNVKVAVTSLQHIIEELYDIIRLLSTDLEQKNRDEQDLLNFQKQLKLRNEKLEVLLKSNISYKLKLLNNQLEAQNEKLLDLKKQHDRETLENDSTITNLKRKYNEETLKEFKEGEKNIQENLINIELKNIELEIEEMQNNYKIEINEIENQYSLLVTHINNYMEKMLNKMQI
ncbi:hypothetical protein TPHA_0M00410 [Tetrapisispora phaffii CBS 4417]|uniref:Kinetochore protein Nuf2 N-terminal domain-containing protein n=1 Tax=Tetrapisispora phaffii (strain ATCC 24235 / CBS 4417 / NBRC 1672 / NRRL Y-8282 / UCD 70-5) TaxID=1071381 RepID=G8C0V5_TETPH|nr:hypothetical protein TPHA_0M00410 [Tetrapisispora phaffii CBS 4417]CCE65616.1 hypothetical protein TPHA_0M00410 [Tetrapisispora phaffii CBS 4417]